MITPEYQEWKEMLMDEITRFPAARLFKDGRIITIPQCTNKGRLPLFYALPIEIVSKQKEYAASGDGFQPDDRTMPAVRRGS